MQQHPRLLEKERLAATEGERDRICNELKEMNKAADEGNGKLTEAMSNGKVAGVFSELNSAIDSLLNSNEELKIKELAIKSLKAELEKTKELETKLAEKDASLEKLKEELSKAQSSEARAWDLLSKSKERVYELESELQKGKESETKILNYFAVQTKELEQTKILLEESKLEATSLHDEVDKLGGSPDKKSSNGDESLFQGEPESLKSELRLVRTNHAQAQEDAKRLAKKIEGLLKEIELLKNELKQAVEAEENSKKAMDDLAIVLKEVATEANQTKEKLIAKQDELENFKKESEELKEKFRESDVKHRILFEEAKKEADLYRNTADRLRLEADESHQAWNARETGFVDCIRIAEDEKIVALEENHKLLEALATAENMTKTAKQENQKLRDILKQALNEANVAKEAAGIARSENSQLKDLLAEKDDALTFITRENENLRINEAAAMENIKELKRLLSEASGKEFKPEEKEQERKLKPQTSADKEQPKERKLSNAFSLNLKDLIIHTLHYTHDQDKRNNEKHNGTEEDEDSENADPLKGSIFDVAESPVAAQTHHINHHHRRKSSIFAEDGEAINPDDLEQLDGVHMDDVENERNPKKKKALLRRFGDIIIRRRGIHRRESSIGGVEGHKKELSVVSEGGHKTEVASPGGGDQGHRKESSEPAVGAGDQGHRKDSSIAE
ncbi:CAP-Gly domain-containing linker protein 1 [Ricinus communis]|uniref:Uncharacterized protein n=1 Tax=Ricinus communis TaxID=3988 RepID=B9T095_RICCO|nr:CAP-Gly domain-containing linker protein 1 [Ricinus communis]XP_048232759.1 CAP-Gly domain-containing linker protein 1 [Ricinus communis]EEF30708.1 conserved hypothetical protein [Ricinus communis]|eukprot:XP_002531664.1 CAP-Gly domain-containing linker protein 1 [Ricinus communis]